MKKIGMSLLVVIVMILSVIFGYKAAMLKSQSEIVRLKGEVAIYKSQAEGYAQVIRKIRETAQQATVTEKAQ